MSTPEFDRHNAATVLSNMPGTVLPVGTKRNSRKTFPVDLHCIWTDTRGKGWPCRILSTGDRRTKIRVLFDDGGDAPVFKSELSYEQYGEGQPVLIKCRGRNAWYDGMVCEVIENDGTTPPDLKVTTLAKDDDEYIVNALAVRNIKWHDYEPQTWVEDRDALTNSEEYAIQRELSLAAEEATKTSLLPSPRRKKPVRKQKATPKPQPKRKARKRRRRNNLVTVACVADGRDAADLPFAKHVADGPAVQTPGRGGTDDDVPADEYRKTARLVQELLCDTSNTNRAKLLKAIQTDVARYPSAASIKDKTSWALSVSVHQRGARGRARVAIYIPAKLQVGPSGVKRRYIYPHQSGPSFGGNEDFVAHVKDYVAQHTGHLDRDGLYHWIHDEWTGKQHPCAEEITDRYHWSSRRAPN